MFSPRHPIPRSPGKVVTWRLDYSAFRQGSAFDPRSRDRLSWDCRLACYCAGGWGEVGRGWGEDGARLGRGWGGAGGGLGWDWGGAGVGLGCGVLEVWLGVGLDLGGMVLGG